MQKQTLHMAHSNSTQQSNLEAKVTPQIVRSDPYSCCMFRETIAFSFYCQEARRLSVSQQVVTSGNALNRRKEHLKQLEGSIAEEVSIEHHITYNHGRAPGSLGLYADAYLKASLYCRG